jgi:hypothetical protein
LGLEIPAPDEFPPIGVSDGPGSTQARTLGSLPTYRSGTTISQGWILDRRAVTGQYVHYAIMAMLRQRTPQHLTASDQQDMIAAGAIARYYNWSFWDYKADDAGGYWSSQLWEIRRTLGKRFGDRLVAFTLKAILDSPEDGADPHFDTYFYHKIQVADSVIDNNAEKMGEITATIEKLGIHVTTPKAYVDFAATSVKRHDGSFTVNVIATNQSGVPAGRGQFRMYFAPDVQVLREPKGALKDPLTTLESSRVIPFRAIAPHTASIINIEFKPLSESFAALKFFLVHFDYQCEACANDNYSHDLKFTLSAFDAED